MSKPKISAAIAFHVFKIKNRFMQLGFKSKTAFYNVVVEFCPEINKFEVVRFWNDGVCEPSLFDKLDFVLERLKAE